MRGGAAPAQPDEARLRGLVRAAPGLTVVTGGQTGVDTYAAAAALRVGLTVHLVFPRGLRQEDGGLTPARRRELAGAAVHELGSASFRYRTWTCASVADVVLLLDPAGGSGCRETARAARRLGRPLLRFGRPGEAIAADIEAWLARTDARVLMVGGCRESVLARRTGADLGIRADLPGIMAGARAWHNRLLTGPSGPAGRAAGPGPG